MSENQNKLQCEIVQDLLPLYHDGVVNTVTQKAVAEHLESCESCAMEYRLLKTELPTEAAESTLKSNFATFAQKLKKKRVKTAIISVILACVILISSFYVLTEIPIVAIDASEYTIYQVYRYEADGQKYFFILYSRPLYDGPGNGKLYTEENHATGELAYVIKERKTILSSKVGETTPQFMNTVRHYDGGNYTALKINDTIIWSEAKNGNDTVPDYVYVIHEKTLQGIGLSYDIDMDENHMKLYFEDGHIMQWDLDGNLLYDSAAETP